MESVTRFLLFPGPDLIISAAAAAVWQNKTPNLVCGNGKSDDEIGVYLFLIRKYTPKTYKIIARTRTVAAEAVFFQDNVIWQTCWEAGFGAHNLTGQAAPRTTTPTRLMIMMMSGITLLIIYHDKTSMLPFIHSLILLFGRRRRSQSSDSIKSRA